MKPEHSEVKTEQSIKTGFNFASKWISNKWRKLLKKIVTQGTKKKENKVFFSKMLQLT